MKPEIEYCNNSGDLEAGDIIIQDYHKSMNEIQFYHISNNWLGDFFYMNKMLDEYTVAIFRIKKIKSPTV